MRFSHWRMGALAAFVVGSYTPAMAGSDNSSNTYAGDYAAGSLPPGTFLAAQYLGYLRADAVIDSTGRALPNSHANIFEEFTRVAYIGQFGGHPLVIDAEIPFATLTDVNIPGTNSLVGGGLLDPVVDITYFFTADPSVQRWLGLTNFFYMPFGRNFDNQRTINVSTAHQFTDVLQVGYTEGLAKLSPALNNLFFDLVANASFHTSGDNPVAALNPAGVPIPGLLTYDTLVQRNSYDFKVFIRREAPMPRFLFVAIGIEKSWGGEQLATNGRFAVTGLPIVIPQRNLSISRDDFLRGHFQFQIPFLQNFLIAGDLFRDFRRVGGFRDSIGAEVRLTKLFFPQNPFK
jgi:hypothetical protein